MARSCIGDVITDRINYNMLDKCHLYFIIDTPLSYIEDS